MINRMLLPTCILLILGCGIQIAWSESANPSSLPTLELTQPLHFLGVDGQDVLVTPGTYHVETTESWLKLLPEGESRSTSLLLEAKKGAHEEEVKEPIVRTFSDPDTPDVLHVALLMPNGEGMEAAGTASGIRPRGWKFAFVNRTSKAQLKVAGSNTSTSRTSTSRPSNQTKAPSGGAKGKPTDCGPYQKRIGQEVKFKISGNRSVALGVFKNKLHMVATDFSRLRKYHPIMHWGKFQDLYHWQFDGTSWRPYRDPSLSSKQSKYGRIPKQHSKAGVALATYKNRLHMVHISGARDVRRDPNHLWHSTFDGRKWSARKKISGQKSKTTPALGVWKGQLHMVHLGDRSNNLWHSMNKGNGWTVNVRIPGRSSDKAPALARVTSGSAARRLHMVYKTDGNIEPNSLWHAQFDGRRWRRSVMIRGPLTSAAPTLASYYPYGMHLIHLGKKTDTLGHMLYGRNKAKNNRIEWFDHRPLLSEKSKASVGVIPFRGCYHMVSIKDDKLMHTTFSTAQVHPNEK